MTSTSIFEKISPVIDKNSRSPRVVITSPGEFVRGMNIGDGAYGSVYMARYPETAEFEYAIKKNFVDPSVDFCGSVRELDILTRTGGHPSIVKMHSVSFSNPFTGRKFSPRKSSPYKDDNLFFVFDKAAYDGHTLVYGGNTSYSYLKLAMVQLLLGIEYLHGQGIIHRDIKPSNTLWYRNGNYRSLRICDFGLSTYYTKQEPKRLGVVTSCYRAPEIAMADTGYDYKSDMWSYGCVIFEMLAKKTLVQTKNDRDQNIINAILGILPNIPELTRLRSMARGRISIQSGALRKKKLPFRNLIRLGDEKDFNATPGTYVQFLDLLEKTLTFESSKRINAKDALDHPFFEGFRNYIKNVRESFPVEKDEKTIVFNCVERKWVFEVVYSLYNERTRYRWYSHRGMFQAIDIFDRYLIYLDRNGKRDDSYHDTLDMGQTRGQFHTRYSTEFRFFVCIYVSIKMFDDGCIAPSFQELVRGRKFESREASDEAKNLEMNLIVDVLNFRIYRPTVYEKADLFDRKLSENDIRALFIEYANVPGGEKYSDEYLTDILKDLQPIERTTPSPMKTDTPPLRPPSPIFFVEKKPAKSAYVPTYLSALKRSSNVSVHQIYTTAVKTGRIGEDTTRTNQLSRLVPTFKTEILTIRRRCSHIPVPPQFQLESIR